LTYLDYALSANGIAHNGFLNVVQSETIADFNFQPGVNCFGTGVEEGRVEQITLYPNPAQDFVVINTQMNPNNQVIAIFNNIGQQVYESELNHRENNILDVQSLPNGLYTIVVGLDTVRLLVFR
jgi:hypothetical protein